MKVKIGIIGGSGVYNLDGLENQNWIRVKSPWGKTSDDILTGNLNDIELAFLPRHSRNHNISPSDIPYQANIDALKRLEVTDIISVSACGSLNENYKPGDIVLVDQYIDRTFKREKSFFGAGCVAHVSMAHPTCERLSNLLFEAGKKINLNIFKGGTYLTMEGPQFSTLAESLLYKNVWNCDVIGMTNMPEAKLAREAEICYASLSMVTDFDCWHPDHDKVEVSDIIRVLTQNSSNAQSLIKELTSNIPKEREFCEYGCNTALDNAIITPSQHRDKTLETKLDAILKRVSS
jgi:5'-methylthioadenosine phosphorylase